MKKFLTFLVCLLGLSQLNLALATEKTEFGAAFTANKIQSLEETLSAFDTHKNKDIVLESQVQQVCSTKGCWMGIGKSKDDAIRVTFKDYGFFVPQSLTGKKVHMHGQISEKVTSVSDQKHYLEDAGASKEEIKKIKNPKKEFVFVASGVRVLP
jgi:hypothetical protein